MRFPQRVLLIDDDEDDSFIFETALCELGNSISYTYSQDGQVAINNLKEDTVQSLDVLFLDWNMPKFSGREVLFEIRNIPAYRSLPIVIYSTSYSSHDITEAKQLGASFFLTKPNNLSDLTSKLKALFDSVHKSDIPK